jgi:2-polyprenyl-3-methyl-5-hydroxy-6-metoxy-1,4-benzoquinol methylase
VKNDAFADPKAQYYLQEKRFMFHLFPSGLSKVLDVGCGAGRVGKALLDSGKAAELIGVELFEPAAAEARRFYKEVHVGDIEDMSLNYDSYFDMVVCGDVLEHLKEPDKVVKKIYRWLKPGGLIVCCVPNIRYWRVCIDLLFKGDWEYVNEGIMDQTHLRFFTTKSFKRMLINASFSIDRQDMRIANGFKQRIFNKLTFGILKEFLGFQILISARKK